MKKLNFTCPHCGGHKLIAAKPLQWIQLDVIGLDDDGDLMLDHDKPSIVDDFNNDFEIYCGECYTHFSLESLFSGELIEEMLNSNDEFD
jgi:transcription elongation factor Elf1